MIEIGSCLICERKFYQKHEKQIPACHKYKGFICEACLDRNKKCKQTCPYDSYPFLHEKDVRERIRNLSVGYGLVVQSDNITIYKRSNYEFFIAHKNIKKKIHCSMCGFKDFKRCCPFQHKCSNTTYFEIINNST